VDGWRCTRIAADGLVQCGGQAAAEDQRDKHRLAQNLPNDAESASTVGLGEGIRTLSLQAGACLFTREAGFRHS